jgi:hypothetical protein
MQAFKYEHFVGIQRLAPTKTVVHVFDLDDTLTLKPMGFDNTGLSKDQCFDASRAFPSDERVAFLARFLASRGDAIAVCTARPADRLCESYQWLMKWRIPFDALLLSTGRTTSGMAKQHMLKYLRRQYKRIGTMVDDSPYNVRGARLQKIGAIHVLKNEAYWANNFELVTKV